MRLPSDLDLLRLEMDALWGPDLYGRPLRPHPLVALAVADEERDIRFATDVPEDLRISLREALFGGHDQGLASRLDLCRERLASLGPARVESGPSYVFPRTTPPFAIPPNLRLLTSDDEAGSALASARPDPWWEPQDWADFIGGKLGPWALAMADGGVASLCHTPVASSTAVEAGVWTHPDRRGRGWAPIVAAAWAEIAASRFETLFYSTDEGNAASRTVARKLGLRSIGTIWRIEARPS